MGVFDKPWTAACATWFRIRLLLVLAFVTTAISIGFSGWQTQSDEGSFKVIAAGIPNFKWDDSICKATPYQYLSPFKFTFNWQGKSWDQPAYCPWPLGNTTYRLIVACFFLVFNVAIFWDTAFSRVFASPFLFLFALLWYSAFVVDAQSLTASTEACTNGFGDVLFKTLETQDFKMICDNTHYGATVAIDLVMFFLVFIVWRAWGHCPNRYNNTALGAQDGTGEGGDDIPAKLQRPSGNSGTSGEKAPQRV